LSGAAGGEVRRDLLITALVFTAIGFVGGYVYTQYAAPPRSVSTLSGPVAMAGPEPEAALPEGHPPLDMAQRWRTLQQQAEANPNDSKTALELANLLFDLQRWEDATFWYKRALTLEPKNTDARTDLATCYFNLGRYDEALKEYSASLEIEPNKPQALYGTALTRLSQKDTAGARQAYEQLRRAHPEFPGNDDLAKRLDAEAKPR
jgi:tetratricopeptide (TPR) repeat protein